MTDKPQTTLIDMTDQDILNEKIQRIVAEISDGMNKMLQESPQPITPAILRESILKHSESLFVQQPLMDGIDYKIQVDGTVITVTPLSKRCIEWFQAALEPPIYEVTINVAK